MIYQVRRRTDKEDREVRTRLMAMAEALEQRRDALASAWDSIREEAVDEVDLALQNSDARFSIALDSAINEARSSIAHAIAVLDAGGYGSCEDCGSPISEARLSYRPESTRCLQCQDLTDRRRVASLEVVTRVEPVERPRLLPRHEEGDVRIISVRGFSPNEPA